MHVLLDPDNTNTKLNTPWRTGSRGGWVKVHNDKQKQNKNNNNILSIKQMNTQAETEYQQHKRQFKTIVIRTTRPNCNVRLPD